MTQRVAAMEGDSSGSDPEACDSGSDEVVESEVVRPSLARSLEVRLGS